MSIFIGRRRAALLLLLVTVGTRQVHAQFEELVAKLPSSANALVLVNVDKIVASPAGMKENWKDRHDKAFAAGLTFLPPDTKAAVLAANYDLEVMVPTWMTAIMALDHEPALPTIVRLTSGTADKFGKYEAVALPGDAYLIKFAPTILAAMAPANRQAVGRWVREVDPKSGNHLSPYLTEAFGYANDLGTPIILAMDLQDVVTEETVRSGLRASEKYSAAKNADQLVKLLVSIRGLTLGITLQGEKPFGKVKVDFGEKVTISAEEGKQLLLHALAERGAMLDELEEWTPKINGQQITLEGYLTSSGIKRLSSLFDRPPAFKKDAAAAELAGQSNQPPSNQQQPNQKEQVIRASQQYFQRIEELYKDLKNEKRQSSTYTSGSIALWFDTYARKIDQLSVVGVDPELAKYGDYASDTLRSAAAAIKTGNARKRVREVNTPMQYDYYTYGATYGSVYRPGLIGGYAAPVGAYGTAVVPNTTAYQHERTRVATEERAAGASQARGSLAALEEATGDIRRRMEQKYNVEF